MNKELYDSFKKLTDTAKNELRHKLKDSPVATNLFEYLDKAAVRTFKNRDVVSVIYTHEEKEIPYAVLENRYFKLRKKFLDEWLQETAPATNVLAEEEQELLRCKELIMQNQKEQAYHKLCELEKECWDKNIFELLPSIIDNLIFCNQTLNKLERNEKIFQRQLQAITLQADCYKMITLARKVYEINFRKGVKYARKELAEIKELSQKNKAYPRFLSTYHHVSLYYKLGSRDYLEDMQVISRHFRQYKELNEKYPEIPLVSYRKNYSAFQHMHYRQIQVFYHFNRMEFEDAYQAMRDIWKMMYSGNEVYSIFKTESIYVNMFSNQRFTERFQEAEETIKAYSEFLKENNMTSRMHYAYTMQAIILAFSKSKMRIKDIPYFLEKTNDYLKSIKINENVQTSAAEVILTKAKLYFLLGEKAKSLSLLKDKETQEFMKQHSLNELYEYIFSSKSDLLQKREIKKLLHKRIVSCRVPEELWELKWIREALEGNLMSS